MLSPLVALHFIFYSKNLPLLFTFGKRNESSFSPSPISNVSQLFTLQKISFTDDPLLLIWETQNDEPETNSRQIRISK